MKRVFFGIGLFLLSGVIFAQNRTVTIHEVRHVDANAPENHEGVPFTFVSGVNSEGYLELILVLGLPDVDFIGQGMGSLLAASAREGQTIVFNPSLAGHSDLAWIDEDGVVGDISLITVRQFNGIPIRMF